jgi:hypothetical protein
MPEFLPSESDEAVFGKQPKDPLFEAIDDPIEEPMLTDKELKDIMKCEKDEDSLYDMSDEAANKAATKKGLVVVYPKDNQIQIDIDSEEAYKEYRARFEKLFNDNLTAENIDMPGYMKIQTIPSSSGLPNRHIYITFYNRYTAFTAQERIHLQSVLGSDPMRELLDTKRLLEGMTDRPTRLFEKPEVAETLK